MNAKLWLRIAPIVLCVGILVLLYALRYPNQLLSNQKQEIKEVETSVECTVDQLPIELEVEYRQAFAAQGDELQCAGVLQLTPNEKLV